MTNDRRLKVQDGTEGWVRTQPTRSRRLRVRTGTERWPRKRPINIRSLRYIRKSREIRVSKKGRLAVGIIPSGYLTGCRWLHPGYLRTMAF